MTKQLKSLVGGKTPAIAEECLGLARHLFRSLVGAEDLRWVITKESGDGFLLEWVTDDFSVFGIRSCPPFNRFTVERFGANQQVFESFMEAIQSMKSQLRDVLGLRTALSRIIPKDSGLDCCGFWFERPEYWIEYEQEGEGERFSRIQNTLSFRVECPRSVMILLFSDTLGNWNEEHEYFKSSRKVIEFPSEESAIQWLEKNISTLSDPVEFNTLCKESPDA